MNEQTAHPIIELSDIGKTYRIFHRPEDRLKQFIVGSRKQYYRNFETLKGIGFNVRPGETVGLIGQNGSGKSTLLQIICGTLEPTIGTKRVHGRIAALLELGSGFNPEFSGRDNVFLNAAIMGLSRQETEARYDDILAFSGLSDEHIDQPVKTYSSGMYVRLAFAVAVNTSPDILVVDEALAVGDEAFQRKCFAKIEAMQQAGVTIFFVSHSPQMMVQLCTRVLVLDAGEIVYQGSPKRAVSYYQKLLFAGAERAPAIREQLKCLNYDQPIDDHDASSTTPTEMKRPESMVEYESHGALISNPHITSPDGEPTDWLEPGQDYIYRYQVHFSEDREGVLMGMFIKTKDGVELGGAAHTAESEGIAHIKAGTTLQLAYRFTCHMREGTYFMNAGCSGLLNGTRHPLHRLVDACMFRVAPDNGATTAQGLIDFGVSVEVREECEG